MTYRTEQDSLGPVEVPEDAYFGAQTRRAQMNFPVSRLRFPPIFIQSLALIKRAAAEVNHDLGLLAPDLKRAIVAAADEIVAGSHLDQFVVDVFQTGSGTSTNMNMNEVVAGRANELLTGRRGGKSPVHPNDHVNMGQSSNDVIPSTIHVAALRALRTRLLPALDHLRKALDDKTKQFAEVHKIGRTHLQDAVPLTLGQEFSGYARQVALGIERVERCRPSLSELALGGTAVGSGLNAHP
jgi:fumarate hydratase class II